MSNLKRIWAALKIMEECETIEAELDSEAFDNIESVRELADALEGELDCYTEE